MAMQQKILKAIYNSNSVYAPYVEFRLIPTEYNDYVHIDWELWYCADDTYYPTTSVNSNCVAYIGNKELRHSFKIGNEGGSRLIAQGVGENGYNIAKSEDVFQDIELYLFFSFEGAKWINPATNQEEQLYEVEARDFISIPNIGFDPNPVLITYSVRYNKNHNDDNDNYGDYGSFTKYHGTDYLLSFQPVRDGYIFKGWSLFTNRQGFNEVVSYVPGDMYDLDENGVVLYAVWESLPVYTISYNANGGSGAPSSQTKIYGRETTLSTIKPVWEGYIFVGWTESFEDSVIYQSGESYTNEGDVTLYAVWFPVSYTISYDANGGKESPSNQRKFHDINTNIKTAKPYKTGFKFIGWSTTRNGSVIYESGDVYSLNESITLYAVWTKSDNNISNFTLYRCDENGNKETSGTYVRVGFDYLSKGFTYEIKLMWKCSTDYEEYDSKNVAIMDLDDGVILSGNSQSFDLVLNETFDSNKKYVFRIVVNDTGCDYNQEEGINMAMEEAVLSNVNYFMDFMPPESADKIGGVGVGKEAEIDNVLDIGLKTRFLGGILYSDLKEGTNFNTLITPNNFALFAGANYINCPINTDGTLLVEPVGVSGDVRHIVTGDKTNPSRYERYYSAIDDTWTNWVNTYTPDIGKIYTATKSIQVGAGIDVTNIGAVTTIPAGVYIIMGEVKFSAGTSTGNRNNQVRLAVQPQGETASIICMERNYAAAANALAMTITSVYSTNKTTTIAVQKSSSIAESSAQDTTITAVRIA